MAAVKRLRAFTMLEVLVTMALSGVVLAVAITAFTIIQRQFDRYRERGGEVFQVQRTRSLFAKDLAEASLVQSAGASLRMQMPDGKSLMYHFRVGVLTREKGRHEDTLATGVTIPDLEYLPSMGANAPVGTIKFTMESGSKTYPLTFYKAYSPADLINLE